MRSSVITERFRNVQPTSTLASRARYQRPASAEPSRSAVRAKSVSGNFERLVDDAILIDRIAAGDQQAARELIERLRPTVLKCIRRRLPRWTSEEDLVQTVFAKIF